jgi:hypothetical protein
MEIWIVQDKDERYECGTTEDEAMERYRENISDETCQLNLYCVNMIAAPPRPIFLNGTVMRPDTIPPVLAIEQVVS